MNSLLIILWKNTELLCCHDSSYIYRSYGNRKFFNIDGIIQIENPTIEEVEKQIVSCNEEDYLSRKDAIIDNFHRVQEYLCPEDYIYEHYKDEVFGL